MADFMEKKGLKEEKGPRQEEKNQEDQRDVRQEPTIKTEAWIEDDEEVTDGLDFFYNEEERQEETNQKEKDGFCQEIIGKDGIEELFYEYEEEDREKEKSKVDQDEIDKPEQKRGRSRGKKSSEKKSFMGNFFRWAETEGSIKGDMTLSETVQKNPLPKKIAMITAGTLAALTLLGGGGYFCAAQKYKKVFFPNTQINGVDASKKTPEEIEKLILEGVNHYVLSIEERNGETEQITGAEIKLRSEFDGSLELLVSAQKPSQWMRHLWSPMSYEIGTMVSYDETAFSKKLTGLNCMDPQKVTAPENARISDYISGSGYSILPEQYGNTVNPEKLKYSVSEAVRNLKNQISLEELKVYEEPVIKKEDAALNQLCQAMNQVAGMRVTYHFGDKTEVLTGDRIHEWLIAGENHELLIDTKKVGEYVGELAKRYNTVHKAKQLKTSYGVTIQVSGGYYGWRINEKEEKEALAAIIKSGKNTDREPAYTQKAASRTGNDYGNTYVEINLTGQHLFFYKDGVLLVESDFVSGNLSRGWGTPAGTFPLTYKQRNATLKGENYRTPVGYWMPFNGGIGMHDATWRSTFGGTIYKTSGSHGCINLPPSVAKTIYENISAGIPVICYNLTGTEKDTATPKPTPTEPSTEAPSVPETGGGQLPTSPSGETVSPSQPSVQPSKPVQIPETTAPAGPGADTFIPSAVGPGIE